MEKFNLNNTEKLNSMKLIQHAKELGLLDLNSTIKCIHCKATFPKEYHKCPQCNTNGT